MDCPCQGSSGCWLPPLHLLSLSPSSALQACRAQGSRKPNPYIKRELEKYLEQNLLTVHPRSVPEPILNQEMALNSRSKHRNKGCQHRNQKQSLTGRGERIWHKAGMGAETQERVPRLDLSLLSLQHLEGKQLSSSVTERWQTRKHTV